MQNSFLQGVKRSGVPDEKWRVMDMVRCVRPLVILD